MWQTLLSNLPTMGVGGIVLGLLIWLMKNASFDRNDYEKQLRSAQARHNEEIGQLRTRIQTLENKVDRYHTDLMEERRLRWTVEEEVARLKRGIV